VVLVTRPERSVILATRVVTVDLPLEPVMATTGAVFSRANSSMSPSTSAPRARASAMSGVCTDTPGLTTRSVTLTCAPRAAR